MSENKYPRREVERALHVHHVHVLAQIRAVYGKQVWIVADELGSNLAGAD